MLGTSPDMQRKQSPAEHGIYVYVDVWMRTTSAQSRQAQRLSLNPRTPSGEHGDTEFWTQKGTSGAFRLR